MIHDEDLFTLLHADTEESWTSTLLSLAQACGFEQVLFAIVPSNKMNLESAYLHSTYPTKWRQFYDSEKLFRIDPTVTHCLDRVTPLIWTSANFVTELQRQFYEEATSYGLVSGVALPIHGARGEIGILSFATGGNSKAAFLQEARVCLPQMALLRDIAQESALRFMVSPGCGEEIRLTKRELECLKWTMIGKTSWEIGTILSTSEATVNFHMANIRRKFNVITRRQAVVKAISLGLLIPE